MSQRTRATDGPKTVSSEASSVSASCRNRPNAPPVFSTVHTDVRQSRWWRCPRGAARPLVSAALAISRSSTDQHLALRGEEVRDRPGVAVFEVARSTVHLRRQRSVSPTPSSAKRGDRPNVEGARAAAHAGCAARPRSRPVPMRSRCARAGASSGIPGTSRTPTPPSGTWVTRAFRRAGFANIPPTPAATTAPTMHASLPSTDIPENRHKEQPVT